MTVEIDRIADAQQNIEILRAKGFVLDKDPAFILYSKANFFLRKNKLSVSKDVVPKQLLAIVDGDPTRFIESVHRAVDVRINDSPDISDISMAIFDFDTYTLWLEDNRFVEDHSELSVQIMKDRFAKGLPKINENVCDGIVVRLTGGGIIFSPMYEFSHQYASETDVVIRSIGSDCRVHLSKQKEYVVFESELLK